MSYWMVIPAVILMLFVCFAFFWVGHEHGVRSSEYYKRRLEYLERKSPEANGNVRLIYESDQRPL